MSPPKRTRNSHPGGVERKNRKKPSMKHILLAARLLILLALLLAACGRAPASPRRSAPEEQDQPKPAIPNTSAGELPATRAKQTDLPPAANQPAEDKVSPEDLLEIVDWRGWGGNDINAECEDAPELYSTVYYGTRTAGTPSRNVIEMGAMFLVNGCVFPPGAIIHLDYYDPDANYVGGIDVAADEGGRWSVVWTSLPDEPLGIYTIEISSSILNATLTFEVIPAEYPLMTTACIPNQPEGQLVLSGFQPFEEVLVGRYTYEEISDGSGQLDDYQYVEMDENGVGLANIPVEHYLYTALGVETPREVDLRHDEENPLLVSAYTFTTLSPWPCYSQ